MPEKMPEFTLTQRDGPMNREVNERTLMEQEQFLKGTVSVAEVLNYIEQDRFLTLKEAAAYVRLSQRTLRRQVNQIQPRPFKYGRKLLFKKSDLDQWMERYRLANGEALDRAMELAEEMLTQESRA